MPRIDPGMQTGFLVQWLKQEGDHIEKGEPLAIGEGEKTTFDIVAPESGILRRQLYPPKAEVQVTETIALIGEANEDIPPQASGLAAKLPSQASAPTNLKKSNQEELQSVSPAARRIVREKNIDLSGVTGTGPGGRVTSEDVLKLASKTVASITSVTPDQNLPRVKTENRLTPTRQTIGERLSYSQRTVAAATIMMDVAMEALLTLKERLASNNRNVSTTAIIVKALAEALSEDSTFNSSLEGELLRIYIDINVAVAIEAPDGLVAPVISHANDKTLEKITEEIDMLTDRARSRKLSISDLIGSTATVSNLGPQGVDSFVPIINPPNTIILGVGSIKRRPIVVGDSLLAESISIFTLVFDHRVGDGVAAARMLGRIKQLLENPELLAEKTA